MRTDRPEEASRDLLRAQILGSPEARTQHRIHAVLLVAGGLSCRAAAKLLGDSPRAVEYWIKRYKTDKIDGLRSRSSPGRPPRLDAAKMAELHAAIAAGPPRTGGPVWRGEDVRALIAARWSVRIGLRQAQRFLAAARRNIRKK